jgi:hypothetical protein
MMKTTSEKGCNACAHFFSALLLDPATIDAVVYKGQ